MSTPSRSVKSPSASDHSICCLAHETRFRLMGAPFTRRAASARICRLSMGTFLPAMRQRHTSAGSPSSKPAFPRSCAATNASYASRSAGSSNAASITSATAIHLSPPNQTRPHPAPATTAKPDPCTGPSPSQQSAASLSEPGGHARRAQTAGRGGIVPGEFWRSQLSKARDGTAPPPCPSGQRISA